MNNPAASIYLVAALGLAIYGLMGFYTLGQYARHRRDVTALPDVDTDALPAVTVQLPIYNERYVVERLIRSAATLEYPADRLQIQVVDDSTDDTTARVAELVRHFARQGLQIEHIRRSGRDGYKAGALANALEQAMGEFIALFDADFQVPSDFLLRTVPLLMENPTLGAVQGRWGHLNDSENALTYVQAIALDKHFMIEQTVRDRARLFPKFNGSAGVWRRACIDDVGGWLSDTVTEDLCLSTRAVLDGWDIRFLPGLVAPAELPMSILAYRAQQARWAKGSTQCLLKYGHRIVRNSGHSPAAKAYALLSMGAYCTNLLLLTTLLVQLPLLLSGFQLPGWLVALSLAGLGQPLLFALAQQLIYPDWLSRLKYMPAMVVIAIGIAPNSAWAILEGIFGRRNHFVRTPKGADGGYALHLDWLLATEIGLLAYACATLSVAVALGRTGPMLFLATCVAGFGCVSALSLTERRQHRRRSLAPESR